MRREWIEMASCFFRRVGVLSPSMRREWIEIDIVGQIAAQDKSPSMRREWIEIPMLVIVFGIVTCLPPCGGSGLKCTFTVLFFAGQESPSMRREWIEIKMQ